MMPVVVISGVPGCGSSTTARLLAKKLKYRHVSGGDFFKAAARKDGIKGRETNTASMFLKSKKGSSLNFHRKLDKMLYLEAKKGNTVIDGKLAIKMLSGVYDFSVWLKASNTVRAKRIAKRDRIGSRAALSVIKERDKTERASFKRIYGFDTFSQAKKADIIIDISKKTPDEITDLILSKIKRVFVIHRWDGTPKKDWLPFVKETLEKKGYFVNLLAMPDTHHPQASKWVPFLTKNIGKPNENTYLVGHSAGAITILRYLETLKKDERIGGCVLVAGWIDNIGYSQLSNFFTKPIKWNAIRKHCRNFVAIYSDNDPYVKMYHGQAFKKNLKAKLIVEHRKGHLTDEEGIRKLPSVISAIEKF